MNHLHARVILALLILWPLLRAQAEDWATVKVEWIPDKPGSGITVPIHLKDRAFIVDRLFGTEKKYPSGEVVKWTDQQSQTVKFTRQDFGAGGEDIWEWAGVVELRPEDIPEGWLGTGGPMFVNWHVANKQGGPTSVSYVLVRKDFFEKFRIQLVLLHGMAVSEDTGGNFENYYSDMAWLAKVLAKKQNWGKMGADPRFELKVLTPMFARDPEYPKLYGTGSTAGAWLEELNSFMAAKSDQSIGQFNAQHNIRLEDSDRQVMLVGHSSGGRVITRFLAQESPSKADLLGKVRGAIHMNSPQYALGTFKVGIEGFELSADIESVCKKVCPLLGISQCKERCTGCVGHSVPGNPTGAMLTSVCLCWFTYGFAWPDFHFTQAGLNICADLFQDKVETLNLTHWQNMFGLKSTPFVALTSGEDNEDGKACNLAVSVLDMFVNQVDDRYVPVSKMRHPQAEERRYGTDTYNFMVTEDRCLQYRFCHDGFKAAGTACDPHVTNRIVATHIMQVALRDLLFYDRYYPEVWSEILQDFRTKELAPPAVDVTLFTKELPLTHTFPARDRDSRGNQYADRLQLLDPKIEVQTTSDTSPFVPAVKVAQELKWKEESRQYEVVVTFQGSVPEGTVANAKICLQDLFGLKSCKSIRVIVGGLTKVPGTPGGAKQEICDDKIDNDKDGQTDEADCKCIPGSVKGWEDSPFTPSDPSKKTYIVCNDKGEWVSMPGQDLSLASQKDEICDDGVDNDGDEKVDEEDCLCKVGSTRPCESLDGCYKGSESCVNPGAWGPCMYLSAVNPKPGQVELCNDGIDNDCDGISDEDECKCIEGTVTYCKPTSNSQGTRGIARCQDDGTWSDCIPVPEQESPEPQPEQIGETVPEARTDQVGEVEDRQQGGGSGGCSAGVGASASVLVVLLLGAWAPRLTRRTNEASQESPSSSLSPGSSRWHQYTPGLTGQGDVWGRGVVVGVEGRWRAKERADRCQVGS